MSLRSTSRRFAVPSNARALASLIPTLLAYAAGLTLAIRAEGYGPVTLFGIVVASIAGLRCYFLQHDCGHNSFFVARWQNALVGRMLAVLTTSSFNAMRLNHNRHHAHSSDLDRRDTHDILTLSVSEYARLPRTERLRYRLRRHPLALLLIGPFFVIFFLWRFPKNGVTAGLGDVVGNGVGIVVLLTGLYAVAGWRGVLVMISATLLAASYGVYIAFLQHNFEDTYWAQAPQIDPERAALAGSSFLDFGPIWHLLTANIAYHGLHHLNPMIPSYRLAECHAALGGDLPLQRVTPMDALRVMRLKLWDETQQRMVPFP